MQSLNGCLYRDTDSLVRNKRLCIKVGRVQGDGGIGTSVWGLGTWDLGTRDRGLEDIKYGTWGSMGRGSVGRGRGDVKYMDAGDAGCE